MKVLLCFVLIVIAVASAASFYEAFVDQFAHFKNTFNKVYDSAEEEKFRFKIFVENKLAIDKHNKRYRNGEEAYELNINKYSDLLDHEFEEMLVGAKINLKQ